ncbi:IS110 family transposase [Tateyamaria pelophila]|uniref:IS110 family transposase n=1 Tax=Tateyamaria pelophila TaxID=328415 RepID=UPI001CBC6AF6
MESKNRREFAAWLGLPPLNRSRGSKERLGRIRDKSDRYLGRLLVIGMTSQIQRSVDTRDVCIHGSCSFLNANPCALQRLLWRRWRRGSSGRSSPKTRMTAKLQHRRSRTNPNCKMNVMMVRAVIRKPEIPCFILNSQVRVADWEQVYGTHHGQRQISTP